MTDPTTTQSLRIGDLAAGPDARGLRDALLAAGGSDLTLDLDGAARLPLRSLQVLLSAAITARASGRRLTLRAADGIAPWLAHAGLTLSDLQSAGRRGDDAA